MTPTVRDNKDSAPDHHDRLRELTAILAEGIHRLRVNRSVEPECREIPSESSQTGLDPGARSCPDESVFTTRERGDS
ncbi:MAG: hypothetical protein AABZ47_00020 [Planctomycetota bacterium]